MSSRTEPDDYLSSFLILDRNNRDFEGGEGGGDGGGGGEGGGYGGGGGVDLTGGWSMNGSGCAVGVTESSSWLNISCGSLNDTLSSSLTPEPLNFWAIILIMFPCLTIFGNSLVVLSVIKEKTLRTATNYFILSLATSDIMVALLVMPLSIYVEVTNSVWELGDALCDTWVAFDVMCCTASILNLTAISVDRFIAVTRPLQYAKHRNSKRVFIMLGSTWVIALTISSPIALGLNYTERRTPDQCTFYNADFLIYSSMGSFYIPCVVMILLYGRIFLAIRARAKKAAHAKKNASKPSSSTGPTTAAAELGRRSSSLCTSNSVTPIGAGSRGGGGGGEGDGSVRGAPNNGRTPAGRGSACGRIEEEETGSSGGVQSSQRSGTVVCHVPVVVDRQATSRHDLPARQTGVTSSRITGSCVAAGAGSETKTMTSDDDHVITVHGAAEGESVALRRIYVIEEYQLMQSRDTSTDADVEDQLLPPMSADGGRLQETTVTDTDTDMLLPQSPDVSGCVSDPRGHHVGLQGRVGVIGCGATSEAVGYLSPSSAVEVKVIDSKEGSVALREYKQGECNNHAVIKTSPSKLVPPPARLSLSTTTLALAPPTSSTPSGATPIGALTSSERKASNPLVTKFNFALRSGGGVKAKKKSEKGVNKRERKATKTLAIVMGVFLFCWVPFFTINIINAICIRYDLFDNHSVCHIDPVLFQFFVWLGYMNSFLNPVIYTIFNDEFRRVFKKLLLDKCYKTT